MIAPRPSLIEFGDRMAGMVSRRYDEPLRRPMRKATARVSLIEQLDITKDMRRIELILFFPDGAIRERAQTKLRGKKKPRKPAVVGHLVLSGPAEDLGLITIGDVFDITMGPEGNAL